MTYTSFTLASVSEHLHGDLKCDGGVGLEVSDPPYLGVSSHQPSAHMSMPDLKSIAGKLALV